jgi:PAS domain S-box-containing protein
MEADTNTENQEQHGWSRELLYQLVDNVKDYAIYCSDLDGLIVSWNIGAEKVFGYPANEAIGQHGRILFTPEDQAKSEAEKELERAREHGYAEDKRWHIKKDGSYFFASGVQTPLFDNTGKHTGYAKIVRDLTERINLLNELEASKDNLETTVKERTREIANSNEELRTEVVSRKQSENLRVALLRRTIQAQEDERKRIARDIHDNIGQIVTGMRLKLQTVKDKYKDNLDLGNEITCLQELAQQIDSEVDFLTWELRPSILDHFGLQKALEKYVNEWSAHFNIPAELACTGLDRKILLPEIETNLYRLVQEALNNVAKHAKANNVSVLLEQRDGKVVLIVEDDGIGFDVRQKAVLSEDDRGMGLLGMKERAELIGGDFEIESSAGNGTTVYAKVPAQFSDGESSQRHRYVR